MPSLFTRVQCRDCATRKQVRVHPTTPNEVLCRVCGAWLHRPPTSKLPCPACRFDADHAREPWGNARPDTTPAVTTSPISLPSPTPTEPEPEPTPTMEVLLWQRRHTEREGRSRNHENTGCVVIILFWVQAGASATLHDLCGRGTCAWPWKVADAILGLGFRMKEWLLPGTGGLHEAALWAIDFGYLRILALVIRSIAAFIADEFRGRSTP